MNERVENSRGMVTDRSNVKTRQNEYKKLGQGEGWGNWDEQM